MRSSYQPPKTEATTQRTDKDRIGYREQGPELTCCQNILPWHPCRDHTVKDPKLNARFIVCLLRQRLELFALSRYNTLKGWNPLSKNCFKQHQREFWICWMKFAKDFAYWRGCLGQRTMSNNSMRTIFRLLGSHMNNIFLLSSIFSLNQALNLFIVNIL